ncbi:calcium-activated chloride channel-domain-containing protein [Leptodontidium sp. MPI-SDFR-AT-0119]|nr:calcium-activated chloride channel-domain-containing protein [Leptodontidium sp. MPI-SDFR-AT-0119]
MAVDETAGLYDDIYVVQYDFSEIDHDIAVAEFKELVNDLSAAGLKVNVQPGPEKSLVVLVKSPYDLLSTFVFKSRVKDWLYGVTQRKPEEENGHCIAGNTETENLRSIFHLVTWKKSLGGAGITPEIGKWKNVKSVYPLHNNAATRALLVKWSRQLILREEDLDQIRGLFGEKVAIYFAFLQAYLVALAFPSITGILAWLYLPGYSLPYAILTSLWCTTFLEYWRLKEVDLSLRWSVKGVGGLKVNRAQFIPDREILNAITGETEQHFSRWKHTLRLLLQIPFALIAIAGLGTLISFVFVIELFISEVYDGPLKFYLEYFPTVLLAISLPFISAAFEKLAATLTEYENHRTEDRHEMALTQKIFVLSSITKYLPILLTAFVYVPCGDILVGYVESLLRNLGVGVSGAMSLESFSVDSSRLRNEVVALVVTEQVLGFGEELILPVFKRKAMKWYHNIQSRQPSPSHRSTPLDTPDRSSTEANFPVQARDEAELEKYNVQDDIQEMVIQFGYLALFSPVWPLIPIGFLINNWIEIRSDFLKICIEHQRPPPIRADSIGPWIDSLSFLNWLGSITTAAVVYLFREGVDGEGFKKGNLYALAATIFVSEHIYLAVRYVVRMALERIGSEAARRESRQLYLTRRNILDKYERKGVVSEEARNEKIERDTSAASLWSGSDTEGSLKTGIRLIRCEGDSSQVKKKC